jgi:hypothetical protein
MTIDICTIPTAHVEKVCKPGQPGCCAYLASAAPPTFFCAKGVPSLLAVVQARLEAGTLGARGDNCAGPPGWEIADK